MQSLLEKNISVLRGKNPELAKLLEEHVPDTVPQLTRDNGYYNFLYKNTYLHNPNNPLGEAKEIFSMAENNPAAIHFVFGLGLGYLFQVASANSQGTVILYEQDLNILYTAFSLVDFTNDLSKKNIYIAENIDKAEEYIYQKSNTKNVPLLLSTRAYQELYADKFKDMVKRLQESVGRFGMDLKYTQQKLYFLLIQMLNNLSQLVNEAPLMELKDYFKGKTAVVVSAGPTLDRNIETIKKYRDNIILIVVGTAMKTIVHHGLKPDFLCVIESNDCSRQIANIDMEGVNFVTEPFSHPILRQKNYKRIFSHPSSNTPINHFWAGIAGIDISEYYSKGTVSYTALNTARILGCSKIVLVGQDLAYVEGQCYSKDSAYKDLECRYNKEAQRWEIVAKDFDNFMESLGNHTDYNLQLAIAKERLENLNKSLYYVKGITGDMIPTESVYAAFIQPMTEFTKKFSGIDYVNTSLIGAQIDGYRNISLEDALKDTEKIENREVNLDFKYNVESIKENLFRAIKEIQQSIFVLDEIQTQISKLRKIMMHSKTMTVEMLQIFRKIMVGYNMVTIDYANKYPLLDYITTADKIDLDYEIKMTKELDYNKIANLIEKVDKFCVNSKEKINQISNIIEINIGNL